MTSIHTLLALITITFFSSQLTASEIFQFRFIASYEFGYLNCKQDKNVQNKSKYELKAITKDSSKYEPMMNNSCIYKVIPNNKMTCSLAEGGRACMAQLSNDQWILSSMILEPEPDSLPREICSFTCMTP